MTDPARETKVLILWSHISGYMASCWRALDAVPGVTASVLAFESETVAPFDTGLLAGVRHRLMTRAERADNGFVRDYVLAERPDVIMVTGWFHKPYRHVLADPRLAGAAKVMCMDTPWKNTLKQWVGRRLLRGYLGQFGRVVVAGERAATYAKFLGFTGSQIRRGIYGLDFAAFGGCLQTRLGAAWPRKFLYVGRYAQEKAIDTLVEGYAKYRDAAGDDAWGLVCCGRGPEAGRLKAAGITDLGFVPPDRQPGVYTDAGAFVMASRYEPWGVAIAEGAAAGLPLVCSDECSATAEVLRDGFNGYLFGTDDATMLAERLHRVTRADLPLWGGRSRVLAEACSAQTWPGRVLDGLIPGV